MIKKGLLIFILMVMTTVSYAGAIVDDTLQAIQIDDAEGVRDGLKRGLDPNFVDQEGNSLLMLAAREGSVQATRVLVNAGARIHYANATGDTALLLASFSGQEAIFDMLTAKGASLGGNRYGWTPLMYAAFAGHAGLVKKLLDLNVNVNAVNEAGMSALMLAAMNGHIDAAKLLLAAKANPDITDSHGRSAKSLALEGHNTDIAALLDRQQTKAPPKAPLAVKPKSAL